jgi:aldehyde dehydrogenase (NAD+)
VNLDEAVAGTSSALFFNAAQCCCAGSRTFVHSSIYDAYVAKAREAAKKIQLTCVSNDLMAMGPVVDDIQHKRVMNFIEAGKASGAKLETGGSHPTEGKAGYYIEPTVFSNVTDEMQCAKEEIFGPVQNIFKFDTLEEVISRANDTNFGLAASIWTNDLNIANVMATSLKAGTVWVNAHNVLSFAVPFGGFKQSGIGRDLGEYAIHEYTQVKAVITQLPTGLPPIPKPAHQDAVKSAK